MAATASPVIVATMERAATTTTPAIKNTTATGQAGPVWTSREGRSPRGCADTAAGPHAERATRPSLIVSRDPLWVLRHAAAIRSILVEVLGIRKPRSRWTSGR